VIKINSFTPINNFTRRSWEFSDDNMIVKTKSLTLDYEYKVNYEKIKAILSKRMADLNWLWASIISIVVYVIISTGLGWINVNLPSIIDKAIVGFALLLILPAIRRYEYYAFLDENKNFLATVRVNSNNKKSLLDALKLIKQKAKITNESYFDDSLPNISPVFQFTQFDFADFLSKSKVFVYEDRIIDVEKSLVEEITTTIKYDELSGETNIAKMGNDSWNNIWSYWLFFVCISGISVATFFTEQLKGNQLVFNLFFSGLALLIPMYFLRFIKSEILVFYDKQDNGIVLARVNSKNREMLNQIIDFVKGKVESQK
jgi:hypothetical protein